MGRTLLSGRYRKHPASAGAAPAGPSRKADRREASASPPAGITTGCHKADRKPGGPIRNGKGGASRGAGSDRRSRRRLNGRRGRAPGGARVSECPKSPRRALLRRPVETDSDWRAHQRPPPPHAFGREANDRGTATSHDPARLNPGAATMERVLMQGGCHSHNVSSPASPAKPGEGRGTSRHCRRKTRRAGVYWMPDQVGHDRLVLPPRRAQPAPATNDVGAARIF